MKFKSVVVAVAVAVVAPLSAFAAQSFTSAAQMTKSGSNVISSGQAWCRDSVTGAILTNCSFSVSHALVEVTPGGGSFPPIRVVSPATGQYNASIDPYPATDNKCYHTLIEVYNSSGFRVSVAQSSQVCHNLEKPVIEIPKENCPIVLDLGDSGLDLGSIDAPVAFDLDADGQRELLSWTAAQSEDALLAFDRNGNGTIDDGQELFGWATKLASGANAEVGYAALAELDANGDGVVDASDAAFAQLRAWVDTNHDGVSQAAELKSLASVGIIALEYDYKESERHDQDGNQLRYRARGWAANPAGNVRAITTYDVIFDGR
ncbi:MAG TPA: hypothetical protein VF618_24775 [Thermoanaerobaculia bacterium]